MTDRQADFNGPETQAGPKFGIEAFRGYRAFKVSLNGMLMSPSFDWIAWHDGVNQSQCYSYMDRLVDGIKCQREIHPDSGWHTDECPRYPRTPYPSTHCHCGFYAYTTQRFWFENDLSPYEDTLMVNGVVEGFGRMVVGSLGFRAEKMRVLAIALPLIRLGLDTTPWRTPERVEPALRRNMRDYMPSTVLCESYDEMFERFPLEGKVNA